MLNSSFLSAVDTDILPDAADTRSLGSASKEWLNLYIGDAGKIYFGLSQDVSLHRSAANQITITASAGAVLTGGLTVGGDIVSDAADTDSLGSATKEFLNLYIGDAGKIYFGLSQDCNIFRAGANILQTDDNMRIVGGYVDVDEIRSIAGQLVLSGTISADSPILFRNANAALDNYATRLKLFASADQGDAGITSYEPVTITKASGGVLLVLQATDADSYAEIDLKNDAQTIRLSVAGAEGDAFRIYDITGSKVLAYLTTAGQLQLPVQGTSGGILLGGDVFLYRWDADYLKIPDNVIITGSITCTDVIPSDADTAELGATNREWLNLYVGDAGKIYFGLSQDISLNRSAANTLTITASSGVVLTGGLTVGSDIVSDTADTDSLGSTSKEFKNLYIGTGSIYIGTSQEIALSYYLGYLAVNSDVSIQRAATYARLELLPTGKSIFLQAETSAFSGLGIYDATLSRWLLQIHDDGNLNLYDSGNIVLGTTTGTKIGTATNQKLAFFNATPVVQQAHIADADGTLADITTKFNTLLSEIETLGLLATA